MSDVLLEQPQKPREKDALLKCLQSKPHIDFSMSLMNSPPWVYAKRACKDALKCSKSGIVIDDRLWLVGH